MIESDFERFSELLRAMGDLYSKPVTEHVVPIWWSALKPYDIKPVQVAFGRHTTNPDGGQFMPKPADIIRLLDGGKADQAMQAWSKVDRAIRSVGTYQSVVFDDPIVHAVISEMGGWVKLGSHDDEAWPFVSNEFQARYKAYQTTQRSPSYPPILFGSSRLQNHSTGFRDDEVRLIGDVDAARRVMTTGQDSGGIQITHSFDVKRLQ